MSQADAPQAQTGSDTCADARLDTHVDTGPRVRAFVPPAIALPMGAVRLSDAPHRPSRPVV